MARLCRKPRQISAASNRPIADKTIRQFCSKFWKKTATSNRTAKTTASVLKNTDPSRRSLKYSNTLPQRKFIGSKLVHNSIRRTLLAFCRSRGTLALRARPSAQLRRRLICSSIVLASGTVCASVNNTDSVVISWFA